MQAVIGKEQSAGDPVERQRLSEKLIIHAVAAIDFNLETGILAAAKLIEAVGREDGRAPKFVRRNGFPKLRLDPKDGLRRMQRAFDVRDTDFVFLKIISKSAGADALVPRHVKIFESQCAVGEMDSAGGAIHPDAAEPRPIKGDCAIASPILRVAIRAPNRQTNRGRMLPVPLSQKFSQVRRRQRARCAWSHCALDI